MKAHDGPSSEPSERLACYLEGLLRRANLSQTLEGLEIYGPDLVKLAVEAAGLWTAQFNPRPISSEGFLQIYRTVATG